MKLRQWLFEHKISYFELFLMSIIVRCVNENLFFVAGMVLLFILLVNEIEKSSRQ
jgi:hypothetical protein